VIKLKHTEKEPACQGGGKAAFSSLFVAISFVFLGQMGRTGESLKIQGD
jgi:hypothetical protein